jgi:hypothetical protein
MGQTQSTLPALAIDTSQSKGVLVTPNYKTYSARSLTPGFLILALGSINGSVDGDIVGVTSEIYKPPPPKPAPSTSGSIGSSQYPLSEEDVPLSQVSVVTKQLGKVQPLPVIVVPPVAMIEPAVPAVQPQQPAANTGSIDTFPCSRAGIGASNLCIEQPYPVPRGSTAYAVWNIVDFSYGEFDRGDGQGLKGPIYQQQRVDVPGIDAPRTIRLRWLDKSGTEHMDAFTIQVVK